MSKELCVLDTCAILNSFEIELAGQRIVSRLQSLLDICVPKEVTAEMLTKGRPTELSFSRQVEIRDEYEECLSVVQRWFNIRKKEKQFRILESADRSCIALALYQSRRHKRTCLLLTDDWRGRPGVEEFARSQRIGPVISTAELIVHLYGLFSEIRREHAAAAITDYFDRSPSEQSRNRSLLMEKLGQDCRALGLDKYLCSSKCRMGRTET